MRYVGDFTRDLDGIGVNPVLARQMDTSTWAPYSTTRFRAQQNSLFQLLRTRGAEVILLDRWLLEPALPPRPRVRYRRRLL